MIKNILLLLVLFLSETSNATQFRKTIRTNLSNVSCASFERGIANLNQELFDKRIFSSRQKIVLNSCEEIPTKFYQVALFVLSYSLNGDCREDDGNYAVYTSKLREGYFAPYILELVNSDDGGNSIGRVFTHGWEGHYNQVFGIKACIARQ